MNRNVVIGELRSVWDKISYIDKLNYIYGGISESELTDDFLENMCHQDTKDIASDLDYLIELSKNNRG